MAEAAETSQKKLVKLSSLKANRDKEREGDWMPATDINPALRWFVRSTNYAPFRLARDAHFAKLGRQYGDDIPDDKSAELSGKLAVEHLLLGWDGLAGDDDEPIEYSKAAAMEFLTDEAYRAVRASVYLAALKVGKGEVEFVEGTAKN